MSIPTLKRRYTQQFKAAAIARVDAGETNRDVSLELMISPSLIINWRRKAKAPKHERKQVKPVRPPRRPGRASPEKKAAVLSDMDAGMPWREIMAKHEIVASSIYRWAMQSGRYLYGEKAIRVKAPGETPEDDRWWTGMKGVEDDAAFAALDLLREGITQRRFIQKTGFTLAVACAFAIKANVILGTPKFLPRVNSTLMPPIHAETSIDWRYGAGPIENDASTDTAA